MRSAKCQTTRASEVCRACGYMYNYLDQQCEIEVEFVTPLEDRVYVTLDLTSMRFDLRRDGRNPDLCDDCWTRIISLFLEERKGEAAVAI